MLNPVTLRVKFTGDMWTTDRRNNLRVERLLSLSNAAIFIQVYEMVMLISNGSED